MLYAVSDDPFVQGAVIDAGEAAMAATVGWLEREAIRVQRGSHNQAWLATLNPADRAVAGPRREPTSGVVAAAFRHRTSRAADPLLHWHVLVANLVEGADGRWSAFAHPDLYRHARTAGEVFQAAFRAELTAALGVEWRPGKHVPEIAGIPQRILEMFSKRSAEIDAWLTETATADSPEGRQAAVLATRRHKPEVEGGRFDADWKIEADTAGWGPIEADGLIAACSERAGVDYDTVWRLETDDVDSHGRRFRHERTVDPEDWIADLLARDLTVDRSTFTRADVARAVAARQSHGADIDTIERLTSRVLASPQSIRVDSGDGGPGRWTSRELADVESRFIATLTAPTTPLPRPAVVEAVAGRPEPAGADQRAAVETICGSESAVGVLVGPAGTGKTFTIDTIRAAFEAAGVPVAGAAPSARAALELSAKAGLEAGTLHRLLGRWERGVEAPGGGLLVLDEAAMADVRTLTAVVGAHVEAGGRVLLAGDHHQLPEIGAGGGFAHAAAHAGTVAQLSVNRRQRNPWEHDALAALRHGQVATAVAGYLTQGRVDVADTPAALIGAAVTRWADARAEGHNPVLLGGTNDLVDPPQHRRHRPPPGHRPARPGRTRRLRPGTVPARGTGRAAPQRPHDRLRRNGDGGGQRPGRHRHHHRPTIVSGVALDGGTHVTLDRGYLDEGGWVSHGYALTSHRAQGGTWDVAIAVGADTLTREGAYVQLSRGTHGNWIVLTHPEAAALADEHAAEVARHDRGLTPPEDQPDPVSEHLTARLGRTGAKHLAHHHDPGLDDTETPGHHPTPRRPRDRGRVRPTRRTPHHRHPRAVPGAS